MYLFTTQRNVYKLPWFCSLPQSELNILLSELKVVPRRSQVRATSAVQFASDGSQNTLSLARLSDVSAIHTIQCAHPHCSRLLYKFSHLRSDSFDRRATALPDALTDINERLSDAGELSQSFVWYPVSEKHHLSPAAALEPRISQTAITTPEYRPGTRVVLIGCINIIFRYQFDQVILIRSEW